MKPLNTAPRMAVGLPAGVAILLLLLIGPGCEPTAQPATAGQEDGDEAPRLATPERRYAEAAIPAAESLGSGWVEIDRAITAYTRYRRYDLREGEGEQIPEYHERAAKLVGGSKPCRMVAGVAYRYAAETADEADNAPAHLLTALYLYNAYYALPLTEEDLLPDDGRTWVLGDDGIAMWSSRVPPGTATPEDEEGPERIEPELEGETLPMPTEEGVPDTDDTESDVTPDDGETSDENADDEEVEEGEEADETDDDPVEDDDSEVAPEINEESPAKEPAEAESTADSLTMALAARGLLVEIHADGSIPADAAEQAITTLRAQLARRLRLEKQRQDDYAAKRAASKDPVILEEKSNPAARFYWELLEKAGGKMYETKY